MSCFAHFLRLRRHYPVKLGVFREAVYKGQHHVPVEDKPLARFGVGDILHLLRGDVELLCKDSPVARRLIEHAFIEEIRKYAAIKELDEVVLNRLIKKIMIGEVQKVDGQKIQEVKIIYNFVGEISA